MRTLSIIISLSLAAGTAMAAPTGRDKPKHEKEKEKPEQAREQAAREQLLRVENNRISDAAVWAGENISGFRRSVQLQLAMRTRPYTVEVENSVTKVRSDYKPLSVNDLVTEIMKNVKSGGLSAEKTALAKEAIVFASYFAKLYTGSDPVLRDAQGAAYRQLETYADMTAPGYTEKEPNAIRSTLDFLVKTNKAASDSKTISEVLYEGAEQTSGKDPALVEEYLKQLKNCEKG